MDKDTGLLSTWNNGVSMATRSWRFFATVSEADICPNGNPGPWSVSISLSQEASDHGLNVGEVVILEYTGHRPQRHAAAVHGQEVEGEKSAGPSEWAL